MSSTTIATPSSTTGLFSKKMHFSKPSINISALMSSKIARLKDENATKNGNHLHDNASENDVCADVVSSKGNYLRHEDMQASPGINIIGAQVDNLKKDHTAAEDAGCHCVLELIPYFLLKKKDPIMAVVVVVEGTAKVGTPLCIPSRDCIYIGRIASICYYGKPPMNSAEEGAEVIVEIVCEADVEQPKVLRRQSYRRDLLVSCSSIVRA